MSDRFLGESKPLILMDSYNGQVLRLMDSPFILILCLRVGVVFNILGLGLKSFSDIIRTSTRKYICYIMSRYNNIMKISENLSTDIFRISDNIRIILYNILPYSWYIRIDWFQRFQSDIYNSKIYIIGIFIYIFN